MRQALEAAVVAALQPLEASHGAKVYAYPDQDFNRAAYHCLILVGYSGLTLAEPATFDGGPQLGSAQVELDVQASDAYGRTKMLGLLDAIQEALTGLPFGDGEAYLTKEGFLDRQPGQWRYGQNYTFPVSYPYAAT